MSTAGAIAPPPSATVPPSVRPNRPAVWITFSLAAGILAYPALPAWPSGYAALAAILAIASLLFTRIATLARCILCTALALTGASLAQLHRWYTPTDSAALLVSDTPTLVRARVRILDLPTLHAPEHYRPASLTCTATLSALYYDDTWHPHSGKLLLRIQPAPADLTPEATLETIGMLSRIVPPDNPGQYNWQEHFARNGIALRLNVTQEGLTHTIDTAGPGLLWTLRIAVRNALVRGFTSDQQLDAALLRTLLLGDNSDLLEGTWADFRTSGTAHHLSISGLHIATLSLLVYGLCRLFLLHPRTAVLIAVAFAFSYALLTRPSPPVWRSVFLCIAVGASLVFRRNTDPLQCLFVAGLAMLLWNPLDLFNPGFQLSFGTVAGLMLFSNPVNAWFWSFEHEHDRMARLIRPPTGLALVRHWIISWILRAISAGLVAYAISMPLIAWHFQQINPWAIVGSIALEFIVAAALFAGLAKIILTLLIPPAAPFLATLAAFTSQLLRTTVSALAQLPGAELPIPPIAPWLLLLCAALLLAPILPRLRTWKPAPVLPAIAVLLIALSPFLGRLTSARHDFRATILSVGNGSCTIIEFPDGRNIMVDCGAMMRPTLYDSTIAPFLLSRGITHIDQLFITHNDHDHTSAVPDLETRFAPQVFRDLQPGHPLSPDLQILAPSPFARLVGNDASTVLHLNFAGRSILFTGDIEDKGIRSLVDSHQSLAADILIAPHHGSAEKSTADLLQQVNPQYIICSSSPQLSRKQRLFDQSAQGRSLIRTGASGAVTITIAPNGTITLTTCRQ